MRCVDEETISVQVSWNKRGLSREESSEAVRDCDWGWMNRCATGNNEGDDETHIEQSALYDL